MIKIGIIGTAGRREDGPKMSKDLYLRMCRYAQAEINDQMLAGSMYNPNEVCLVSGGAAWSDHVAVTLFLVGTAQHLRLYLPCAWDHDNCQFHDMGPKSPGRVANYYHSLFSKQIGIRPCQSLYTLDELITSYKKGFFYSCHDGFHARNLLVGQVDILIAFTWGEGDTPKDGGTAHTWNHSPAPKKVHISLGYLL